MSLEFMDGFDHYSGSTNTPRKWDTTSRSAFGAWPDRATGRFGGSSAAFGVGFNLSSLPLTQGQLSAVATRTVGFALYPDTGPNPWNTPGQLIFQFMDGTNEQVSLRTDGSGLNIQISRNGTTLATSTPALIPNSWCYVEFQVTIGSSSGAYTLKVWGGASPGTWLTATGVNTQATANATTNGVCWINSNNSPYRLDDVYILNSSGTTNNTFIGESKISTFLPNGDGASSQWTPSTGTTHYTLVDESDPNDDTDYNASLTSGQIDLYTYPPATITGAVIGVQVVMTARKDDVGARQIAEQCRSGGTNYSGATKTLASTYSMYREIREVDPATSVAWTQTGLNAAQFGAKII